MASPRAKPDFFVQGIGQKIQVIWCEPINICSSSLMVSYLELLDLSFVRGQHVTRDQVRSVGIISEGTCVSCAQLIPRAVPHLDSFGPIHEQPFSDV